MSKPVSVDYHQKEPDMNEKTANPLVVLKTQIEARDTEFQAALPAHIPVERFKRVLMTAIQNNPDLMKVERRSLFNSAMRAAQDGLLPDGREGAIVVYNDKNKGPIGQWMVMIAGLRKKVRNSNEISTWDAQVVHENDEFDYSLGDNPFIHHKPALADRGKVLAAYSVATLKSGEKSREVMAIDDILKVKARSKAKDFGPWKTDFEEMCRKTVARRHSKVLPMSTDLDDLIRRDDELYDIRGSGDAAVKSSRPSLHATLDRLALSQQVDEEPTDQPEQSSEAFTTEESPAVDLDAVYQAGRQAALEGKNTRALPPALKEEGKEAEKEAWLKGHADASAEADE